MLSYGVVLLELKRVHVLVPSPSDRPFHSHLWQLFFSCVLIVFCNKPLCLFVFWQQSVSGVQGDRDAERSRQEGARPGDACATGSIPRPAGAAWEFTGAFTAAEIQHGWFQSHTSCITRKEFTCQGNWHRCFLHKIATIGVQ